MRINRLVSITNKKNSKILLMKKHYNKNKKNIKFDY